jgi:hypothetical protein
MVKPRQDSRGGTSDQTTAEKNGSWACSSTMQTKT